MNLSGMVPDLWLSRTLGRNLGELRGHNASVRKRRGACRRRDDWRALAGVCFLDPSPNRVTANRVE